ncbi:MAG: hypothetical protein ACRDKA_02950 [Actinomycetota bacterium]
MILEYVVAVPLLLIGLYSGWRSLADPVRAEDRGSRLLIAVHEAAKAGFWLAFGGFFLAYGLLEQPQDFRWFALVPVGMAGLRLLTAAFLARG